MTTILEYVLIGLFSGIGNAVSYFLIYELLIKKWLTRAYGTLRKHRNRYENP